MENSTQRHTKVNCLVENVPQCWSGKLWLLLSTTQKTQMIQVFSTYVESLSFTIQFSEHFKKLWLDSTKTMKPFNWRRGSGKVVASQELHTVTSGSSSEEWIKKITLLLSYDSDIHYYSVSSSVSLYSLSSVEGIKRVEARVSTLVTPT